MQAPNFPRRDFVKHPALAAAALRLPATTWLTEQERTADAAIQGKLLNGKRTTRAQTRIFSSGGRMNWRHARSRFLKRPCGRVAFELGVWPG